MAKLPSAEDAALAFAEVANAIALPARKRRHGCLRADARRVTDGGMRGTRSPGPPGSPGPSSSAAGARSWSRRTTRPFPLSICRPPTCARPTPSPRSASPQRGRGARVVYGQGRQHALVQVPAPRQHVHAAQPAARRRSSSSRRAPGPRELLGPRGGRRGDGGLGLPRVASDLPAARRARPRAQVARGECRRSIPTCRGPNVIAGPGAAGPRVRPRRSNGRVAGLAGHQPLRPWGALRAGRRVRQAAPFGSPAPGGGVGQRAGPLSQPDRSRVTPVLRN